MTHHFHGQPWELSEAKLASSSCHKAVLDRLVFWPDSPGEDGIESSHRDNVVDSITDEMYKLAVGEYAINKTESH